MIFYSHIIVSIRIIIILVLIIHVTIILINYTLLRCLVPLLRYQTCVGATRVQHTCVCDPCRVRVLVRLSHPRPSVVTVPVYRGCPAGTHWGDPVSRVRPDQSANSCCACWCVVVRRTCRRGKSRPYVCWVSSHTSPRQGHGCGPVDLRRNLAPLVAHRTRCHS